MKIGFVVPGRPSPTSEPQADLGGRPLGAAPAVHDSAAALAGALVRLGHEVQVEELATQWWRLSPAGFAEQAAALAGRLEGCEAVLDFADGWSGPAGGSGTRRVVSAWAGGAAPTVDVEAYPAGTGGGGGTVVAGPVDRRLDLAAGGGLIELPHDADRTERAALLGDAAVFVAGQTPADAIAAAEALACGAPVVALAGSPAAGVVVDGVTGVIAADLHQLADTVRSARQLDRWACRKDAYERFSPQRAALDLLARLEAAPDPADRVAALSEPALAANAA